MVVLAPPGSEFGVSLNASLSAPIIHPSSPYPESEPVLVAAPSGGGVIGGGGVGCGVSIKVLVVVEGGTGDAEDLVGDAERRRDAATRPRRGGGAREI